MKLIRKLLLLTLFFFFTWIAIFIYNKKTDGFSLRQITSSLPEQLPNTHLSKEQQQELQTVLKGPFRYLGKGCQFYAFESDDKKYVIKFLKHKHLRPLIPYPKKTVEIQERVNRLFSSCRLAYSEMADETGVLYIHLNRTPSLNQRMILIDKAGWHHTVNLDAHEYIIQKKARSLKDVFQECKEDRVQMVAKIRLLADLVVARCQKSIADRDRSFAQNVAFNEEGTQAVFVDIGQFYKDPTIQEKESQKLDVIKRLNNLRFWMERHFPEQVTLVDAVLSEML